ncbi:MAG TPA: 6-carboxytetrahydropterin synthase [Bacteroidales bacterium]|nr:6-carboxytetrahydropterin synthase [Bacteroidales bacterium]
MSKLQVIRLSKEFRFEAAHALWNYDGLCRNIHGHSYILRVTIKGTPVNDTANPKNGMVMDFSALKKIVKEVIVEPFDHAFMVNDSMPESMFSDAGQMFGRIMRLPYQPTCENMIVDFAARIRTRLPNNIILHSLRLYETSNSFAEWLAEDNL